MDHVTALPGSTKCDEKLPAWPNLPTTGPFFFFSRPAAIPIANCHLAAGSSKPMGDQAGRFGEGPGVSPGNSATGSGTAFVAVEFCKAKEGAADTTSPLVRYLVDLPEPGIIGLFSGRK